MAFEGNPRHIEVIEQGVEMWNNWREEYPYVKPDLSGTNLSQEDLSGANLQQVNFSGANMVGVDLSGADLYAANLHFANLYGSNLSNANLEVARLLRANLLGSNLYGTDLSRAQMADTVLAGINLSETKGLHSIFHLGPSIIDNQTLEISHPLPEEFLYGIGLNKWQIEQAKLLQPNLSNAEIKDITSSIYALRSKAAQLDLFISYNHKDSAFVDRLEPGFINKSVRFWRDIHEMVPGPIEDQIDRGMRQQDTVLLVLSKHSVNSLWVQHEVRKAIKIQLEENRKCLCPVALDNSWKSCNWPERIREQIEEFYITDFSGWEDENTFAELFSKLLDGLEIFYKKQNK